MDWTLLSFWFVKTFSPFMNDKSISNVNTLFLLTFENNLSQWTAQDILKMSDNICYEFMTINNTFQQLLETMSNGKHSVVVTTKQQKRGSILGILSQNLILDFMVEEVI